MLTFVSYTDRKAILAYFQERFGIPEEAFDGFRLLKKGRTIWAVKDGPGLDQLLNLLKVEAAGVPLIRIRTTMQKPTTATLSRLERLSSSSTAPDMSRTATSAFIAIAALPASSGSDTCLPP